MIGHHNWYIFPFKPVTTHPGDTFLASEESLGSGRAERANGFGTDYRELPKQKLAADLHLIGLWSAILGRPAFHDVADVHVLSFQRDTFSCGRIVNHLSQELAGPPDKRQALHILVSARAFADENQPGLLVAGPEDDGVTANVQPASLAVTDVFDDLEQRVVLGS